MKIIDRALGLLSEVECVGCGAEGFYLCGGCQQRLSRSAVMSCGGCNAYSVDFMSCKPCRSRTSLDQVAFAAEYSELTKRIVHAFKYQQNRSLASPVAELLFEVLPNIDDAILVHVPTAAARVRQRGFDHAKMLTLEVAALSGLPSVDALVRIGGARQVGVAAAIRRRQSQDAYRVHSRAGVSGRRVLLVDDVVTTGATLSSCARVLVAAGAKSVHALALARV